MKSSSIEVYAECETCGLRWSGKNAMMVAKKHYTHTGHTVRVRQVLNLVWSGRSGKVPGELFGEL